MRKVQFKRYWPIFLLLALLSTGCQKVMLEPDVDLRKLGKVALLEFDNLTQDWGIAREATALFAEELEQLPGMVLLQPRYGDRNLNSRAASGGDLGEIAAKLGADTLLIGAVTYYFEDIYMEPPRRVLVDKEKETHRWEFQQEANVEVSLSLQLITKEQKVLFSRRTTGKANRYRTRRLPWPSDSNYLPPYTSIPGPDRRDIPKLRQDALKDATRKLAKDYLPQYTYEW